MVEIVNMWDGVAVLDCGSVQGTVVTAGMPVTQCFLVKGRSPAAGRWSDDPQLKHVLKLIKCNFRSLRNKQLRCVMTGNSTRSVS